VPSTAQAEKTTLPRKGAKDERIRSQLCSDYSADLLVDNRLIIELKAAKALADEHVAQILGYLRASRVEHGLLINFGAPKFDIKKYALSRVGEANRLGGLIGGMLSLLASLAPLRGLFHPGS
jgi:hypothetical protein